MLVLQLQRSRRWGKESGSIKSAKLPWPATLGKLSNDEDGSMDWRYACDHDMDVPERLTFHQAQCLAAVWPKLDQIEFHIDDDSEAKNQYWTWSGFNSFPLGLPPDSSLN